MPTPSDERMAKLKAAINQCRKGDLHALSGLAITSAELATISALAKATGDTFTYDLAQRLIEALDNED
jgi:Na+/proline symporter